MFKPGSPLLSIEEEEIKKVLEEKINQIIPLVAQRTEC